MSRLSPSTKISMRELAVEIIKAEVDHTNARAKGYDHDSARVCALYDQSDSEFCAARVKSLLDELAETQAENRRLRETSIPMAEVWAAAGGKPDFMQDRAHVLGRLKTMDEALDEEQGRFAGYLVCTSYYRPDAQGKEQADIAAIAERFNVNELRVSRVYNPKTQETVKEPANG